MGNDNSTSGGGSSSSSSSEPGLNTHCYNVGYDHGSMSTNPDPVGDGISAAPCTTTDGANKAYAKGYTDAMKASDISGVNSGDGYSQTSLGSVGNGGSEANKHGTIRYVAPGQPAHGCNSVQITQPPEQKIKVYIQVVMLDGISVRTLDANVSNMDTLNSIKEEVKKWEWRPIEEQKIYFNGLLLEGNNLIYTYGINDKSTVVFYRKK
jgi:hypothetical protein